MFPQYKCLLNKYRGNIYRGLPVMLNSFPFSKNHINLIWTLARREPRQHQEKKDMKEKLVEMFFYSYHKRKH